MTKRYDRPLTTEELAALPDSEIDTSDIPELDEKFWANARIVAPQPKGAVSLRLPDHVIEHFKAEEPKGYTTRMAAVLAAYVEAARKPT